MKLAGASILFFAAALARTTAITDCSQAQCPTIYHCSDPRPVDGQCCKTCEGSSCVWRGCVIFGAFGPRWYPDPCTLCGCYNGEEVCRRIECEEPQCFGYPLKKDNNYTCCAKCDWGIAEDDCGPIPVANISLYATLGDNVQCRYEVTKHECDKTRVAKNGRILECRARRRGRPIVTRDCEDIRKIVFEDTTRCRLEEPPSPISDLPNPNKCALTVPE